MKIEITEETATLLFQAVRAFRRQIASKYLEAEGEEAERLEQLAKEARCAEVDFMAAVLRAKTEEHTQ